MISVVYEKNPAGDFWLRYDDCDTHVVDHMLGSKGWEPSKASALAFCQLAMLHNIFIIQPEELYKAVPHVTTITEVVNGETHA